MTFGRLVDRPTDEPGVDDVTDDVIGETSSSTGNELSDGE